MKSCPVCEHLVRDFDECCNQCGAELTIRNTIVKVDEEEVQRLTRLADELVKSSDTKQERR
jgi:predicted amidophosphoribosyltransferase